MGLVIKSDAILSADLRRGGASQGDSIAEATETALFEALEQVFLLERSEAMRLSREAYGAIASFLADVTAHPGSDQDETQAMAQFDEMRNELEDLKRQLREFMAERKTAND